MDLLDVYDYCTSGELALKIFAPPRMGLMWEFDRETLYARRVFASTIEATTNSYVLKFLAKYGNIASVSAVERLKQHPFHYVRWDVAKALGEMDEDALMKLLYEFKEDVHPHVQQAAIATLNNIEANYGD